LTVFQKEILYSTCLLESTSGPCLLKNESETETNRVLLVDASILDLRSERARYVTLAVSSIYVFLRSMVLFTSCYKVPMLLF
jgi:hypothetical protein